MMVQLERDLLPTFAERGRFVDEAAIGQHQRSARRSLRLREATGVALVSVGARLLGVPSVALLESR
jgi:hypothetical protein